MRLLVGPMRAVERLLAAEAVDHVLTLISPNVEAPPVTRPRTLLRFNDIVEDRPGLVSPCTATMAAILDLRETLRPNATLLVHCEAGVSRSTAAAYALACAVRPPGEESSLAAFLRGASPEATPNALMVALADAMLERGGAMSRAIADVGRGVDAFEGTVVDWRLS